MLLHFPPTVYLRLSRIGSPYAVFDYFFIYIFISMLTLARQICQDFHLWALILAIPLWYYTLRVFSCSYFLLLLLLLGFCQKLYPRVLKTNQSRKPLILIFSVKCAWYLLSHNYVSLSLPPSVPPYLSLPLSLASSLPHSLPSSPLSSSLPLSVCVSISLCGGGGWVEGGGREGSECSEYIFCERRTENGITHRLALVPNEQQVTTSYT